jgi:hypothetical protein
MSPYLANNQPTALSHVPLSCYWGGDAGGAGVALVAGVRIA